MSIQERVLLPSPPTLATFRAQADNHDGSGGIYGFGIGHETPAGAVRDKNAVASADVFLHVPAVGETIERLIEIQVKSGMQEIGMDDLYAEVKKSVRAADIGNLVHLAAKGAKSKPRRAWKLDRSVRRPIADTRECVLAATNVFVLLADTWQVGVSEIIGEAGGLLVLVPGDRIGDAASPDVKVPAGMCVLLVAAAVFGTWAPRLGQ
eukprot:c20585_g2_i10.p1 GENE.c20585_g2_i10~~c20585_g2_i10.p1  ORF type:complete len:207 (+),score=27.26 c20585_g2_i10:287-907(+)